MSKPTMNKAILQFLQDTSAQDLIAQNNFVELFKFANTNLSFHQMEELLDILKQAGVYFDQQDLPREFVFIRSMIGRKVRLDHVDSELWEDDPEDENEFRRLLGHTGVVMDYTFGEYDSSMTDQENFQENFYWDVQIDGKEDLMGLHGSYFTLMN